MPGLSLVSSGCSITSFSILFHNQSHIWDTTITKAKWKYKEAKGILLGAEVSWSVSSECPFYFSKDKGQAEKRTKKYMFPSLYNSWPWGSTCPSEDGFVVKSRGLSYAYPPLRELPSYVEKCGSASMILLEALGGGKEPEKLFVQKCPGTETENARHG